MARLVRLLLAVTAAVAATVLANAIIAAVGEPASEGIAAPPTPVAVGRRYSPAALFRSLRE
jgi:hypothetical protein